MKKILMVVFVVVAVSVITAMSVSHVMAAEKGAAKTILIDKTSVSKSFSPASTYIMIAGQTRTPAPTFPTLTDPPSRGGG